MNVELGTEAAQFPEKEYINGIFLTVYPAENSILPCSPLHFMLLAVQFTVYTVDRTERAQRIHGIKTRRH